MREIDFYQKHLDGVSRSFAFCIQKLDSPFRHWVSLSYILCRVLDTIEDSPWSSLDLQESQYREFDSFMTAMPAPSQVSAWASRFPESIPHAEIALIADAGEFFADLHELPPKARAVLQTAVSTMSEGMHYYSKRAEGGSLRLTDLADVNRYCYFVAGVVGELLSQLFVIHRPHFQANPLFHTSALHFGLFLQKINLLKDQRSDERLGRYLVPHRETLLASLRTNARGAMDYLLALPREEKGYRTFCAWSLFLGAASLPWMEKSYDADDGSKIPRSATEELLKAIEDVVQDNVTLENAFQQYLPFLPEATPAPSSSHSDGRWFRDLTAGTLAEPQLAELGM